MKCRFKGLEGHKMPNLELDAIDRRIISTLQENGRLSNVELADRVGLSPSPCLRRVRRLERQGYIEAYRAVLQRRLVGLGLTEFSMTPGAIPVAKQVLSELRSDELRALAKRVLKLATVDDIERVLLAALGRLTLIKGVTS